MGLQNEPGTQFPMRPGIATFETAANFTPPSDATNPADWTAASSELTPVITTELMTNSKSGFGDSISINATNTERVDLLPGQYKIEFEPTVAVGAGASGDTFAIAIANGDQSTVHVESEPVATGLPVVANQAFTPKLVYLLHVSKSDTGVDRQVTFLAQNRTAGTECVIQKGYFATITKIGNPDETV